MLGLAVLALTFALSACCRLGVLGFLSVFHRKTRPRANPSSKIAVVVYAHDQEFFIEKVVRSIIMETDYPAELFDVVVVADNCEDSTAYVATFAGAVVLERSDKIDVGRHYALEWAFARLMVEDYDAFLLIDADIAIPPKTLSLLDAALEKGALAIRLPFRRHRAYEDWSARLDDVVESSKDRVIPRGNSVIGLSAGLVENGFCLAKSLLREIPYQAFSENEYFDYHVRLALAGERVKLVRGVELETRNPIQSEKLAEMAERRSRARRGAVSKRAGELFKKAFSLDVNAFECLADALTPSLSTLAATLCVTFVVGLLLSYGATSMEGMGDLMDPALGVMAASLAGYALLAAHVALALIEGRFNILTWLSLVWTPFYVLGNVFREIGRISDKR